MINKLNYKDKENLAKLYNRYADFKKFHGLPTLIIKLLRKCTIK